MGLLDGILSQVVGSAMGGGGNSPLGSILSSVAGSLGGAGGTASAGSGGAGAALGGGAILAAVMGMVQSQGGVAAVLSKLRASGLGAHVDSWVGTGANQPVSGTDLHNALGSGAVGQVANQLGINPQQAGGVLSQVLPELINQMSPSGALPDNHGDLMSKGLEMLRGLSR